MDLICSWFHSKLHFYFDAGPFLNLNEPSINVLKPVYTSQFYLVAKIVEVSSFRALLLPFKVFSLSSWFVMISVLVIVGWSMNIIKRGCSKESFHEKAFFTQFGSLMYESVTLFVGKRPVPADTEGPEKLVLFGFTIFTLFTVATLTGAITTSLLQSLDDTTQGPA